MIKIGSTSITKAYLGSAEVSKIYLGSTLLWEIVPVDNLQTLVWNLNNSLTIENGNDFRPVGSDARGWSRDFIPAGGVGEIRGRSHITIFGLDTYPYDVPYSSIDFGVYQWNGYASEYNSNSTSEGVAVPDLTYLRVRADGTLVHQEYSLDDGLTWTHIIDPLPQPSEKLYAKISTDPGEYLDDVYGKGFQINYMIGFEPLIMDNYLYDGQLDEESNGVWMIPNSNGETTLLANYKLVDGCMFAFRYDGTDDYSILGIRDSDTIGTPDLGFGGDGVDGLWAQQNSNYPNIDSSQISAGDFVIMEYVDGIIKLYKSTDGITLTLLTTGDLVVDNIDYNSRICAKLYSYNNRGGSKLYYPQGKGLRFLGDVLLDGATRITLPDPPFTKNGNVYTTTDSSPQFLGAITTDGYTAARNEADAGYNSYFTEFADAGGRWVGYFSIDNVLYKDEVGGSEATIIQPTTGQYVVLRKVASVAGIFVTSDGITFDLIYNFGTIDLNYIFMGTNDPNIIYDPQVKGATEIGG